MDQTTPYTSKAPIVLSVPLTLMLAVGTGGAVTSARIELLKDKNSDFAICRRYSDEGVGQTLGEVISVAQDIGFIKSVLKVSASELAKCVGVSRQSLYNWKTGCPIKSQNADRFYQLKMAATLLAQEGLGATAHALRRTLPGGKTLLESIRAGGDGYAAAQELIAMLRNERITQKTLAERFSGRPSPVDPESILKLG